jgi:hypothetical protein
MAKRTRPLTEESSNVEETTTLEEIKEEFENLEEDFQTLEKASKELLNQVEDSEVTEDETQVETSKTVPQYFIDLGLKYCPKCCERLFLDVDNKPFCNDNLPTINCPYLRGEIV